MHDRSIARLQLGRLDPSVFFETGINLKILILHRAFGRHIKRLVSHVDDQIRLARQLPAIGIGRLFRKLRGVTFRAAGINPLLNL